MDRGLIMRRTAALVACAALLLPSGAAADSAEGQWGSVGKHHLRDGPNKAGAVCEYKSGGGGEEPTLLLRIVVKPPVMFGSTTAKQRVGWRARIQSREFLSNDPWKTILGGTIEHATATAKSAAAFTSQAFGGDLPSWWFQYPGSEYRVLVDMVWFHGADPVGGATQRVHHLAHGTASATCWQGGN